jgi:hypothetical protein
MVSLKYKLQKDTTMKKTLLSLSALFAVSMASAQSYIKQPDPTTYQVVEYKPQPKEEKPVAGAESNAEVKDAPKETEATTEKQAPETQTQPATKPEEGNVSSKK